MTKRQAREKQRDRTTSGDLSESEKQTKKKFAIERST